MSQNIRVCRKFTVATCVMLCALTGGRETCSTAAEKAEISRAIAQGAEYLRANISKAHTGRRTLAAYALYKAGSPANSSEVASALQEVLAKFDGETYRPGRIAEAFYEAGVEALLLADIDPEKYRPQIQAIADYLIENRLPTDVWDYKGPTSPGDTSVTQYGCLGLWAAARAGADVPDEVWDKMMLWHFKHQRDDGGFTYMPGTTTGPGGGASTLNMTAAAIGSMSIAALYLYPEDMQKDVGFAGDKRPQQKNANALKFGILEKEDFTDPSAEPSETPLGTVKPSKPKGPYKVQTTYANYKQRTQRALGWLAKNFEVQNRVGPAMYYYYSLERMGALTNVEMLGPHDWFNVCADFLIKQQNTDGAWNLSIYDTGGSYVIGTSFGVLFMTRSTAKLLNRLPRAELIGGGLLTGGRGLPDDLSQVELENGRVATRVPSGPLDELLNQLSQAGGENLFEVQEKIIEKIQLGDRSELVGQTEQLVKLVQHPDPQIRRTALWALGRSDDLGLVRHAVAALLDDPDVDVLVEAHNALCWFSRRPDGFGLPDNPLSRLSPEATDDQKRAAVENWRKRVLKAWGEWYLRVCPYEQRDDPFNVRLKHQLDR